MMIGRSDDPEHPARITGVPTPRTCLGLDRGTHLGQRQVPRKQAGHMTAHRTVIDSPPVTPCNPGPSTHDPATSGSEQFATGNATASQPPEYRPVKLNRHSRASGNQGKLRAITLDLRFRGTFA
jgi:hypothetical protein